MSTIATEPAPSGAVTPLVGGTRVRKWSREEYYKLGDLGFFQGKRVELIRGEIFEMSPINWAHRIATGLLADALQTAFSTGFYIDVQQPFVVSGSEPEPDVAVIPGKRRDYTDHPSVAALIVEVADATLFYDTTTKAELYATAGVTDYWVLDLVNRQLHVFRDPVPLPVGLGATAYRTHQVLGPTESVSPLTASTASIKVADLLP